MPVTNSSTPVVLTGIIAPAAVVAGLPGWLRLDGNSIGNAASGATARANGDTLPLYRRLWAEYDNTALPILDSGGAPAARGASADADFVAGKRLPLPALGRDFIRNLDPVLDAGRVLGSHKAWQLARHKHWTDPDSGENAPGSTNSGSDSGSSRLATGSDTPEGNINGWWTEYAGGSDNGGENTPDNTAFPHFIHL